MRFLCFLLLGLLCENQKMKCVKSICPPALGNLRVVVCMGGPLAMSARRMQAAISTSAIAACGAARRRAD